ncbi:MAG: TIGR04282 family arsenosugar biosynthesis glycosyltransferase [Bacteroidota bacterium]
MGLKTDPKSKRLLLIFTRNPELGKCKTRLAAKIGDQAALDVYVFLLEHTRKITGPLQAAKQVYYSEEIAYDDLWSSAAFEKKKQVGDDLGKRMQNAFAEGFAKGYKHILIIGSDMYDLSTRDLEGAFNALEKNEVVLGPAEDGGYYLLGLSRMQDALFQNKEWGTETVLEDSLANLKDIPYFLLEEKNDVDYYEDIKDIAVFKPFLKHLNE